MAQTSAATLPLSETISVGQRTIITITVMAATMMEVLDTSIVNVALPNMQGELGATLDEISWVSTGYIISNVIVLPLTGWLSDFFGRKRYLLYSVILFTLASFGCGISRSLEMLVTFRILQGLGGAAFLSTAQATLLEIYPKDRQGFAQALFGMGVVMAPTLGPTLGGYLVDHFTWPWIFNVNIPIGILSGIFIWTHVPDSSHAGAKRKVDLWGIVLLAIGLGCLQTILEKGERDDWFDATYIRVLAFFAVAGIAAFLWWQLHPKNKNPAINVRIMLNRNLFAGSLCAASLGFALYGTVLILPQFWQLVQAHTAQQTGMLLFPGGVATAIVMPFVGRLIGKVDVRLMVAVGMLLHAFAMTLFSHLLQIDSPDSVFTIPLMLRGFAIGLQFVPLSVASLGTLSPKDVGQGAGLYNLFRQLGGSFGIAALATMLSRRQVFHYDRLAESMSGVGPMPAERIDLLTRGFVARGFTEISGHTQALRALTGQVLQQAASMAFMDLFVILTYSSLASLGLLFLFAQARGKAGAASVH